jgi:outer membrane lipoprotein-sorting protein
MEPLPRRSKWARRAPWAVPLLTVGVVLGAWQLGGTASAATHPNLPNRSAAQLLAAVQTSTVQQLSGTVTESAALGLPSLPGADNSASLSWQALVTGSHTARVWVGGPDKQRVALLGTLSESDVVHNGNDVWTYSSDRNEVSHVVLHQHSGRSGESSEPAAPATDKYTPMGVANDILKTIDPSTKVSVGTTQVVAGHDVYTLNLAPRDTGSTVRKVSIAIDSTHFVPLRVQVFGAGARPAFQVGFARDLSFASPDSSLFNFHAPAGATVSKTPFTQRHGDHEAAPAGKTGATAASGDASAKVRAPTVLGSGWTSIAYFEHGLPAGVGGGLLNQATSPVGSSGDRLLTTALLNVLFTSDGRAFVGAVSPAMLEHAATTTK